MEPYTLKDVEQLRAWAVNRLRYRRQSTMRFLLMPDGRGRPGWGRLDGKEESRELAPALYDKLAAKWPRGRNDGRVHLTAAGVYDLVGHSGPLKVEAKRLARLDAEWAARRSRVEEEADAAFALLYGVEAARQQAKREHPPRYCTIDCRAPGCVELGRLRRRADDDAQDWLHRNAPELDGRSPLALAGESDEGLARALFLLEGVKERAAAAEAARSGT